jgi:hypothetical protein
MKLKDIVERLSLEVLTPGSDVDAAVVTGGCCCDLLSHVLASASTGDLWITIQHHANVVAVAQVTGLTAVLIADGKRPDEATLERARAGRVLLLTSPEGVFELAGRLYRMLTG